MQKQLLDHHEGLGSRFVTQRLATALGLSAGAISLAELAQAADAEPSRTLNTLVMPDAYEQVSNDRVLLRLNTGEQLSLTSDQFVILDGGLLLVVDELAQEAINQLPVMGAVRTQLLTEVQPVRSADGSVVEATDAKPLWSGDGDAPRLFEQVDIGRYELAQAHQESQFTQRDLQVSSTESSKSVAAFGGPLGLILVSGLFHNEAETVDKHQAAAPIIHPYNNFAIRLDGAGANDQSGWPVTSAGDVDGDGKDDILIGAFGADPSGKSNAGETYLVFGSYLATKPETVDLNTLGSNGIRLDGVDVDDNSGYRLSPAGDVDGDEMDDILVNAFGADTNGGANTGAGETYLVFGSYLATRPGAVDLNTLGANGIRLDGIDPNDGSGGSISSAGDVDGDGRDDILIGAAYAGTGLEGETYLVFGSYLATKPGTIDLNALDPGGIRLNGANAFGASGGSVSSAGDVDGDGKDDILIGAWGAGKTYLLFGSYLASAPGYVELSNFTGVKGVRLDGINASDFSGASVSSAGDVDGDGKDDILIGAWLGDVGANTDAGETYLISGHTIDQAADGIGVANAGVIDLALDLGLS